MNCNNFQNAFTLTFLHSYIAYINFYTIELHGNEQPEYSSEIPFIFLFDGFMKVNKDISIIR